MSEEAVWTRSGRMLLLAHADPCEDDANYGCQHERLIAQAEQEARKDRPQLAAIRALRDTFEGYSTDAKDVYARSAWKIAVARIDQALATEDGDTPKFFRTSLVVWSPIRAVVAMSERELLDEGEVTQAEMDALILRNESERRAIEAAAALGLVADFSSAYDAVRAYLNKQDAENSNE